MDALAMGGPLDGHHFTVEQSADGEWPNEVTLAEPGNPDGPGLRYVRANTTGRPGERHLVFAYADEAGDPADTAS